MSATLAGVGIEDRGALSHMSCLQLLTIVIIIIIVIPFTNEKVCNN